MSTIRSRTVAGVLIAMAMAGASSCVRSRVAPEPEAAVTGLLINNHSPFDLTIYTVPEPYGAAQRVGTVSAKSDASFPLHANDLDAHGQLVVRLYTVGPGTTWTSNPLPVTVDVPAVLDVNSNMSGDCSGTTLRTTLTSGAKQP